MEQILKNIEIINYESQYRKDFERLNLVWMNKYFTIEAEDMEMLSNPEEVVIRRGGRILFLRYKDDIIGTAALKYVNKETFELAKMAVDESYRGIGLGKLLCFVAIVRARQQNAKCLILYSSRSLKIAIGIYRKLGFEEIPLEEGHYQRANIKMMLKLTND